MNSDKKIPVIAVLGPTASGKTSLAVALAVKFNGEVVSCDSMQIYKGMSIATAKPTQEETAGIPHHLIDFVAPEASFSASDYVKYAKEAVNDIALRGKNVFLCGGTGLYADSFLNGMIFTDLHGTDEKREELKNFYNEYGKEALFQRLGTVDPEASVQIDRNNIKRVIRAIEICECSGKTVREYNQSNLNADSPYNSLRLVIDFKDREKLYNRINSRVDIMLERGLVREAEYYCRLPQINTASQAIGYKELKPYFDGEISFDEAIENLKKSTRHYAKRQLTWFRRNKNAVFLYADCEDITAKAEAICEKFLKGES